MSVLIQLVRRFFHGVTLDLWRQAIPPKQTKAEADFLVQNVCTANPVRTSSMCRAETEDSRSSWPGVGSASREWIFLKNLSTEAARINHAASLTHPIDADGTDSTARVLDIAPPDFILGDKRAIEGEHIYDGAYCFGNSFGFLEYDDMEKFLSGMARALKPGSRFVVETAMAAESFLPDFEEQTCHQVGDITLTTKERYNAAEGCIDSEYILERDGRSESRLAKHWIYTAAEIQRMLRRAGFEVLDLYGSLKFGTIIS